MKFLKRILIGYTILFVMGIGAIAYILSGCSDRVIHYVADVIEDLEK